MKFSKSLLAIGLLLVSGCAVAEAEVPGSAEWYLHVDFEKMRSEEAGQAVYGWVQTEIFDSVHQESGIDLDREIERFTAFSIAGEGPVIVIDGTFGQETKDKLMTYIAAEGDINPLKASGRKYYRIGGPEHSDTGVTYEGGDINIKLDTLEDGSWISMDVRGKLLITGTEDQMQALLSNKGRIAGTRSSKRAILVLTAEKTLLQAGMYSGMIEDDGDSNWDSNILRNTTEIAFLMAAAANKLAIEAQLVATEPDMAESLASVVRGLIALMSFDDSMGPDTAAVLRGTSVEARGNSLHISLAVDPELLVQTFE